MLNYTREGSVAVLQLDDGKVNCVGHAFVDAVEEGLDRASEEAGAVVVIGRPGVFSAGFDLKEFEKGPEEAAKLRARGAAMLLRVFTHPQPVVAACTGHAVAAGALFLLACDTRLGASGEFTIGLNETAIDKTLPVFGLELARARLSPRFLTAAVTQARMYDPQQAVAVGFLDRVVSPSEQVDMALEEATAMAALPATAYAGNKLGIRRPIAETIRASLIR